eukprot:759452-Hanusia_phi.AAC.3
MPKEAWELRKTRSSKRPHVLLRATNEVRCMSTTRHGFLLTGHMDGDRLKMRTLPSRGGSPEGV